MVVVIGGTVAAVVTGACVVVVTGASVVVVVTGASVVVVDGGGGAGITVWVVLLFGSVTVTVCSVGAGADGLGGVTGGLFLVVQAQRQHHAQQQQSQAGTDQAQDKHGALVPGQRAFFGAVTLTLRIVETHCLPGIFAAVWGRCRAPWLSSSASSDQAKGRSSSTQPGRRGSSGSCRVQPQSPVA